MLRVCLIWPPGLRRGAAAVQPFEHDLRIESIGRPSANSSVAAWQSNPRNRFRRAAVASPQLLELESVSPPAERRQQLPPIFCAMTWSIVGTPSVGRRGLPRLVRGQNAAATQ
jgi:hypothetical protein